MKNLVLELVCTRISHDIIGNIGAVANASELLEDGDLDFLDDIKSILKISSFNLTARMKFFRMAFGLDNNNLNDLDMVRKTAQDYVASLGNAEFPIILDLAINNGLQTRTALVMIMVMADILIRGGKIAVTCNEHNFIAEIAGDCRVSEDKWHNLTRLSEGDEGCINANTAPLAFLIEMYGLENINLSNDNGYRMIIREK